MEWLKGVVLSCFFLILLPFAIAEATIDISQRESYNLGDKIAASVSLVETKSYSGFLKIVLVCDDYDLQYYTIPLNLEANFRTQILVPELPLFESMKGTCSIRTDFEDTKGNRISRAVSNIFLVTDDLNILTEKALSSLPDKILGIEGKVNKISGESLGSGNVKISFNNEDFETGVEFGIFQYGLKISSGLDIGTYDILIAVEDKNDNYASEVVKLTVLPIATSIENSLESESLKPGTELNAKIRLYDHKERDMSGKIKVYLIDAEGKNIITQEVESSGSINYAFSKLSLPGTYKIISKFEDIEEETEFEIESVGGISMRFNEESVIVENIGNVEYDDETTIVLESDEKKYLVNKKIKLDPGETKIFDLSKEVPEGTYDIILPLTEDTKEKNETFVETNVIEDVQIEDNRPVYKKVGSGLTSVTGAISASTGYISSRPLLASLILIVIIVLIALYYGRGLIIAKIKMEKPGDDTADIFKDYKFEEEKKE